MAGTLQEWVEGFEKEMRYRFNPNIKIIAVENGLTLNMPLIAQVSAKCAKIEYGQMFLSNKSKRTVSDARMAAIYLGIKMLQVQPKEMGLFFNRHRTSIVCANSCAKNLIHAKDKDFTMLVDEIFETIQTILKNSYANTI